MMTASAALVLALIVFFPQTRIGLLLRTILVEQLADRLNALTKTRIAVLASLAVLGAVLIFASKGQITPLLGQMGVEAAPWILSFDLLSFVDVAMAVILLRFAVRFAAVAYSARVIRAVARRACSDLVSVIRRRVPSRPRGRVQKKGGWFGSPDEDETAPSWFVVVAA